MTMFPVHARCVTFDAGYAMERERASKELELGRVYTVQAMHVHQSSTTLEFWEIRGSFGSGFFEPVDHFGRPLRAVNEADGVVAGGEDEDGVVSPE